jgi:site-specific recombinase XerD
MKTEIIPSPEWRAPLAGYLAWLEAANRPSTTQYQRSYHLRRFAAETGLSPRLVTHDDLIAYLGSHAWGPSTTHAVRSTFRSFYFWAFHVAKIVEDNPTALLPSTRPDVGQPRPAGEDDILRAIATADERVQLMLELGAYVGLRCCEIAKTHTGDMRQDILGDWVLRVRGKGRKPRELPVPRRIALKLRTLEPGYLFPGNIDGHLSPAYVSKLISRALPAGVTAHMLRHRFASRSYVGSGRDIRAVQKLLGHSSVATTEIYTAVPAGALRDAVEFAAA